MKYGGLVGNVIMGVYLISLSYSDMKRRKLSVGVIVLGFLSALVFQAITGIESWRAVAGGILTGFLFMGISRREDWIWRQSSDYCTRYFPWNVEVTDITFGSVWTGGSSINSVDDKKKVYEKKYDPICPISYSCIYG